VPYLSASAVVIHYEVALYQVYAPLPIRDTFVLTLVCVSSVSWLLLVVSPCQVIG